MYLYILLLFVLSMGAGLLVFAIPKVNDSWFKLSLVFAGAYLFSITIIHMLPELFVNGMQPDIIGIFVLAGFFMQLLLEYFTSGVEHGHLHHMPGEQHQHHSHTTPLYLLIALCVHAFLEGTLLAHPAAIDSHHASYHNESALFMGIILHKMPAAFALMSVLLYEMKNRNKAILYLIIFSLASPAGLFVSQLMSEGSWLPDTVFLFVFAIVCGNFLHISTTIFFESAPEHKFQGTKLIVSIVAALFAIVVQLFL